MKFGKLADIGGVDFSLPPDHPSSPAWVLEGSQNEGPLRFYIGCTGWSMKEWVGSVYPVGAKAKDYLYHYSRQFNTIELNTTHYRIPSLETIRKWYEETPADFRFCPKIPQTISHSRDLGIGGEAIRQFADAVAGLAEKLGCCFLQLPPFFGADRLPLLTTFLERLPAGLPLAVELRHESWFGEHPAFDRLLETMRRLGLPTVLTDVAGRRDVLHMALTTPVAMIRFVGNGLHPTDYERTAAWVDRCLQWQESGLESVYFFTHEPDNILAPQLAGHLYRQLQEHLGVQTRGPSFVQDGEAPGSQMTLF